MDLDDLERLSRLLDGDLPPDEAARLRSRLETEPALRDAFEQMRALPERLAALPHEAPPRHVDEAVLRRTSLRPGTARTGAGGTSRWPLAVAAAAVLAASWLAWPRAEAERVLADGTEVVDGRTTVAAGDVLVDVDGRARIDVEPRADVARGDGAEGPGLRDPATGAAYDMSIPTHLAAAVAGAAVTVTVYAGTATLHGGAAGDGPLVVAAGESRTVSGPPSADDVASSGTTSSSSGTSSGTSGPITADEAAAAKIADLQRQLDEAKLQQRFNESQLASLQGRPQAWPADVPEAIAPDGFRARLDAAVAADGKWKVADVDCDEYPCVALLEARDPAADPRDTLGALSEKLQDGIADPNVLQSVSKYHDPSGQKPDALYAAVAITPGTDGDDDVNTRTKWRADGMMQSMDR